MSMPRLILITTKINDDLLSEHCLTVEPKFIALEYNHYVLNNSLTTAKSQSLKTEVGHFTYQSNWVNRFTKRYYVKNQYQSTRMLIYFL